jgi:DNA repair protein RadC
MSETSHHGHRSRMRKKMLDGQGNFLDYELLELLLFNVFPRRDVKPIAKTLLKECGRKLSNVFFAEYSKLKNIENVSDSTISMIFTIKQIMQKILHQQLEGEESLTKISDLCEENQEEKEISLSDNFALINYLKMAIGNNEKESFCVLYLNIQSKLIAADVEDYGTVDRITIYHREIIRRALELNATGIVLSHNHPSGNCKPSKPDILLTEQLQKICVNIGIKLVDHIIISKNNHFSFYKNALI